MKIPKSFRLSPLIIKKLEQLKLLCPDKTETEIVEEAIDLLLTTTKMMMKQ